LGGLLVILAILLSAQGKDKGIAIPILIGYLFIAAIRAWLSMGARESRYALQGFVISGLFDFINKEVFARSNHTRFTLFREAPLRREKCVVPWYRFRRGGTDPIKEADTSRARYRLGEGVTGQAWQKPARDLVVQLIPRFATRRLMEAYHIQFFHVLPETASSISDYIVGVKAIISYAYLDHRDQFMGLVSLDIRDADITLADLTALTPQSNAAAQGGLLISSADEKIEVDSDTLFLLLRAIGNVLESFQLTEKGTANA